MKRTFASWLPWYCYTIKTNSRTIRSRLLQPASVSKGRNMSELQAHHCMTLCNCEPDSCAVWVSCRQKHWHCKNQINYSEFKIPTSSFSTNICFIILISIGENARFAHPANAHAIIDYFISGSTNKASSSHETLKRFWLIVSTS